MDRQFQNNAVVYYLVWAHNTITTMAKPSEEEPRSLEDTDEETDEVPPTPSPCPEIVDAIAAAEIQRSCTPDHGKRTAAEYIEAPLEKRAAVDPTDLPAPPQIVVPGTPPPTTVADNDARESCEQ